MTLEFTKEKKYSRTHGEEREVCVISMIRSYGEIVYPEELCWLYIEDFEKIKKAMGWD